MPVVDEDEEKKEKHHNLKGKRDIVGALQTGQIKIYRVVVFDQRA